MLRDSVSTVVSRLILADAGQAVLVPGLLRIFLGSYAACLPLPQVLVAI